jgi:asparagine synthase (glutamine-hydrolysing)
MCGITGIITTGQDGVSFVRLQKMTGSLAHRGPNGEGLWLQGAVGLGHRRLAIIDTSGAAAQPMHHADRYTIVHNGEIYNYLELRQTLQQKGYRFASQSDTEVILAAFDHWGPGCLQHFDGMFAFAIWDEKEQSLFAARDRFGEKPFYYCLHQKQLLFASEMKALWAGGMPRQYSPSLLLNYLALGLVQHPVDQSQTFFENILSLPPAHSLHYRPGDAQPTVNRYWQLAKGQAVQFPSPDAAAEQLLALLQQSVQRRLRSDVAVGTSLSGGIDSGTIAALANRSTAGLKSFSAVFPGFEKDESAAIAQTAGHLHIPNHTTQPDAEGLVAHFDKLCHHQEQPFGSASIFAQYQVFALAAQQQVTVLLDGQGADETLAGYHRYLHWHLQQLWRHDKKAFAADKKALLQNGVPLRWGLANLLAALFPQKAASRLAQRARQQVLGLPGIDPGFLQRAYDAASITKPVAAGLNDMLYHDTVQMGLEELLRYADRNSMAHGREVRLPFLSHELVTFVFSLPAAYKIHDGFTKWVLRKAVEGLLPPAIVWQTNKTGFEPPQRLWMQHEGLQQLVYGARKQLVEAGILHSKVLTTSIQPRAAHEADNFDWRCLTAAGTVL